MRFISSSFAPSYVNVAPARLSQFRSRMYTSDVVHRVNLYVHISYHTNETSHETRRKEQRRNSSCTKVAMDRIAGDASLNCLD